MLRFGVISLKASIAALLVLTWFVTPAKMWQWQVSLWVLECGHWLAASAVAMGLLGALLFRFWLRWLSLTLGLLIALTFFIPAYEAKRIDSDFKFSRLWSVEPPQSEKLVPLAKVERKTFYRSNGDLLYALIYRPEMDPEKPRPPCPWLISLHTGGWDSGSVDEFAGWNRELAGHGYAVMCIDYHLAPRYKWPRQKEDVSTAVHWARENAGSLGIVPDKLVLIGRSAGGQIATACALTMPDLGVRGCIALYSPVDMRFAHDHALDSDIIQSLKLLENYLGGSPEAAPEAYRTASAIEFITPKMPQVLLMHGTRDPIVWVEQSRRFKARCEREGLAQKIRLVEPSWGSHGFDYFPGSPGSQLSMHEVVRFLGDVMR